MNRTTHTHSPIEVMVKKTTCTSVDLLLEWMDRRIGRVDGRAFGYLRWTALTDIKLSYRQNADNQPRPREDLPAHSHI